MRKVRILGIAFFAMLAFGVVSVASASAASPQWLCGGAACAGKESAVTEGKWTLRGLGIFGIGEVEVECNGKLVGTVGPGAADEVTAATDLNGNTKLSCTVTKQSAVKCEGSPALALVEAEHLPWATELLKPTTSEIIDHFTSGGKGKPAFNVECLLSSGKWTLELCEGNVLTKPLSNESGGVSGSVLEALSESCNTSGNTAHVSASGLTKLLSGTLSVS